MRLAIISHKQCWIAGEQGTAILTDGGFPLQVAAIAELFQETRVVVPCLASSEVQGLSPLPKDKLTVVPLDALKGEGLTRKLRIPLWMLHNVAAIWRAIRSCDAVHTPIPGDIGTIGMLIALLQGKPLFVRHCGNWLVQRTTAERFWKWAMERFAGGKNVMLATGGSSDPPSKVNPNIEWIFSTSLRSEQIDRAAAKHLPAGGAINLAIACRQERNKGTETAIACLPRILKSHPNTTLNVIGGGSLLEELRSLAKTTGVSEHVIFHGKVEQRRVLELLEQAHIFCYPTRASEGFPKVVLEALASGLPVVTTSVSVLPQLIGDDCGVVLQDANAESVAEAVTSICSDPALYHRMSSNAISVASEYSLEKWRDRIGEALTASWKVNLLDCNYARANRPTSL